LGEVAKYRNGKAHENCIDESGKYIVVNSKFVSTNGTVIKHSNMQNEPLAQNEIAFVLSDVPNGRAIARTFLVEENDKYTLNQRIAGITSSENTYPYFLHILMNRHPYFLAFDDGVKQTNLSVSDVLNFETYYPEYEEQKQIGEYFRNLDRLITLHQRKCQIDGCRFQSPLAITWEQRKAIDIADYSKGNGYSKGDLTDAGTPIILYGRLYTKYQFAISEVDTFAVPRNGAVYSQGNEVIVPASGETAEDIARASAVEKSGVLLGGDLNILRPFDFINPLFLALAISNGEPQKELAKKAQGKSVVHIHNTDIQEVTIAYPSRTEQDRIVSVFRQLDNLITLHQCE
jgi:restriction endonuclease S subunit